MRCIVGSGMKTREVVADAVVDECPAARSRASAHRRAMFGHAGAREARLLDRVPACTDLFSKPWVQEAGVEVLNQPFFARDNVATAGGCLSSQYLAAWIIARTAGEEAAPGGAALRRAGGRKRGICRPGDAEYRALSTGTGESPQVQGMPTADSREARMDLTPTQMRRSSLYRGLLISLCIGGYAWVFHKPGASFTELFLVGVALQVLALLVRRFVPPDRLPQAMYIFELLVDGATVLLFALGVFGGILSSRPSSDELSMRTAIILGIGFALLGACLGAGWLLGGAPRMKTGGAGVHRPVVHRRGGEHVHRRRRAPAIPSWKSCRSSC